MRPTDGCRSHHRLARLPTVVLAALLLLAGCADPEEGEGTTPPPPNYTILGRQSFPLDDRPSYYVLVDPVDLGDDGFKLRVKRVLTAIAESTGTPDFTAKVYDDEGAARWAFDFYERGPESCGIGRPSCQIPVAEQPAHDAMSEFSDRHIVAFYAGGYQPERSDFPYELSWYSRLPISAVDTGAEVAHEGREKWRPMPDPTTPPPAPRVAEPLNGRLVYVPPYADVETWAITSTCDTGSGDCAGEVTFANGSSAPLSRTDFGPWIVDRRDSETGWDCGLYTPADGFPGRKADIRYTWEPGAKKGTVTWVAPRGTCMPAEQTYQTSFIFM